ncbi:MAG: vWA domain-containing protein [Roseiflexaceae bacterium]
MKLNSQISRSPVGAQGIEFIAKVSVTAPKVEQSAQRLPLNIGLVIDRSGSMGQVPMEHAKAAAIQVIEKLQVTDYCTVVIFDTHVDVLADGMSMTSANKQLIIERIRAVHSRGGTDLHAGWSTCVERQLRIRQQELVGRVFLLSDGHANAGITDEVVLGKTAAEYHQQGISTTTFGIGNGYNEMLMGTLASNGEGNTYYISETRHIEECFSQELSQLFTAAIRKTQMHIDTPVGYAVTVVGDRPLTRNNNRMSINFGTLMSEEQRYIYLHIKGLAPQVYGTVVMPIIVEGIDQYDQLTTQSHACTWEIVANAQSSINDAIEREAADVDVATLQQKVMHVHRRRYKDSLVLVQQHAQANPIFSRFGVYDELMTELNRPWQEDDYKMRMEYSNSVRKGSSSTESALFYRSRRAFATGNEKEMTYFRDQYAKYTGTDTTDPDTQK